MSERYCTPDKALHRRPMKHAGVIRGASLRQQGGADKALSYLERKITTVTVDITLGHCCFYVAINIETL